MVKNNLSYTVLKDVGFRLLSEGTTIKIRAEGYSMYPVIKPGSVLFIKPYEQNFQPVPGEIIAWKKGAGFVVHRLTEIINKGEEKYLITRGDSSPKNDEPVSDKMIAGKVIEIENPDGKIISSDILIIKNPNYLLNNLLVKIILQIYRIKKLF
jgi:signal peptidase I